MAPDDRHELVTRIFGEVCNLPPDRRERILAERCADDPELRAEVERLLAKDQAEHAPIDEPALGSEFELRAEEPGDPAGNPSTLPERIGEFRIVKLLGAGSIGIVYLAEQDQPRRRLALKVLRPGPASDRTLRRFEREAEILARLQHPCIAQVYATGTIDGGYGPQPYFALEYVDGRPLIEHVRRAEPDVRERLELLLELCDAVQHAHQRGIVHRDLKPGNILVDTAGRPKILDFGIARITDGDVGTMTLHTEVGQLIGTVPYMSPEQAGGDVDEIDTRSDVYALGVIGFELLSGRLPYRLEGRMIHEAARIIREQDPDSLGSLDRSLRGDLDAVLAKALEKDKARRYPSASELAADIRRYLDHEPVEARKAGPLLRLRNTMRRHRVLSAAAIGAALALVVGAAATSWQAIVASQQRDRAAAAEQAERQRADRLRSLANLFMTDILDEIETMPGATETRRVLALKTAETLEELAAATPDDAALQGELAEAFTKVGDVLGKPGSANVGDSEAALRNYERALAIRQDLARQRPSDADVALSSVETQFRIARLQYTLGETDSARERYEQAIALAESVADADPDNVRSRRLLSKCLRGLASLYEMSIGDVDRALELAGRSVGMDEWVAEKTQRDHQSLRDLQNAHSVIGRIHATGGRHEQAVTEFRRSLSVLEELRVRIPDDTATTRSYAERLGQIGDELLSMRRLDETERLYHQSLAVIAALAEADPNDVQVHMQTSFAHERLGTLANVRSEREVALGHLRDGLAARERAAAADPESVYAVKHVGISHIQVGQTLASLRRPDEAIPHLTMALEILDGQVEADPADSWTRQLQGIALNELANAQERTGDLESALATTERSTTKLEAELAADPASDYVKRFLSFAYATRSRLLRKLGRLEEALASQQELVALRSSRIEGDAPAVRARVELARGLEDLGELVGFEMERHREGLDAYLAALEIHTALADESDEYEPQWNRLANIQLSIAILSSWTGDTLGAAEAARESVTAREAIVESAPEDLDAQQELLIALRWAAELVGNCGLTEDSVPEGRLADLDEALALHDHANRLATELVAAGADVPTEQVDGLAPFSEHRATVASAIESLGPDR